MKIDITKKELSMLREIWSILPIADAINEETRDMYANKLETFLQRLDKIGAE